MANKVYPHGKKHLVTDVNWLTSAIYGVAIDLADYVYDETDEFLADIAAASREELSGALNGKTASVVINSTGDDYVVLDAANFILAGASGDPVEAFAIVAGDPSNPATSALLSFHDTAPDNTPYSIILNGGDINIATSDPNGIIRLS